MDKCFTVVMLYKGIMYETQEDLGKDVFEEAMVLVKASTEEEAEDKATQMARTTEEYEFEGDKVVIHWDLIRITDVYEVKDQTISLGQEVTEIYLRALGNMDGDEEERLRYEDDDEPPSLDLKPTPYKKFTL